MPLSPAYKFGHQLKKLLHRSDVFSLLSCYRCGWSDGGCLILLDALVEWSHGEIEPYVLFGTSSLWLEWTVIPHHAVGYWEDWWIDADGFSRLKTLISRWENLEFLENISLVHQDDTDISQTFIEGDEVISHSLAQLLESEFGSWPPF